MRFSRKPEAAFTDGKACFFEKKKQKTFIFHGFGCAIRASLRRGLRPAGRDGGDHAADACGRRVAPAVSPTYPHGNRQAGDMRRGDASPRQGGGPEPRRSRFRFDRPSPAGHNRRAACSRTWPLVASWSARSAMPTASRGLVRWCGMPTAPSALCNAHFHSTRPSHAEDN
jgi:hypothetical protein